MSSLIYPELSYKINGILFKVHNELGKYRNEQEYADAIENQLKKFQLKYKRELNLSPSFEGEKEGRNKVDFLIEDCIILEIKAKRIILKEDYFQVKRYLVTLNKKLGILVNFRSAYLQPKRILNSNA